MLTETEIIERQLEETRRKQSKKLADVAAEVEKKSRPSFKAIREDDEQKDKDRRAGISPIKGDPKKNPPAWLTGLVNATVSAGRIANKGIEILAGHPKLLSGLGQDTANRINTPGGLKFQSENAAKLSQKSLTKLGANGVRLSDKENNYDAWGHAMEGGIHANPALNENRERDVYERERPL